MAFYRKFDAIIQDVFVIGCGGTGSRVIPPLIQEIKQAVNQINPKIYLVDGDVVEVKNLSRQNFISKDVTRNKAIVLAERYGAALDFPVVACPMYVTNDYPGNMRDQMNHYALSQGVTRMNTSRKIVIMCVDSVKARMDILAQCMPSDIIIDAGNEDTYGQVSIYDRLYLPSTDYDRNEITKIAPFSGDIKIPFIPAPLSGYLDAILNPPVATGSCADLDQSLAVNFQMASGIISAVQSLVYNNKIYCRTNNFDIIKGNSSERMTNEWLYSELSAPKYDPNYDEDTSNCLDSLKAMSLLFRPIAVAEGGISKYLQSVHDTITESANFIDPALLALLGK